MRMIQKLFLESASKSKDRTELKLKLNLWRRILKFKKG